MVVSNTRVHEPFNPQSPPTTTTPTPHPPLTPHPHIGTHKKNRKSAGRPSPQVRVHNRLLAVAGVAALPPNGLEDRRPRDPVGAL